MFQFIRRTRIGRLGAAAVASIIPAGEPMYRFRLRRGTLAAALVTILAASGAVLPTAAASVASPEQLAMKILLIGEGPADVTTAAWRSALDSEGVPYTLVNATGAPGNESVSLPALSSGSTGNYNGVVIADSPGDYAAGALTALTSYESAFGVRQVDGYMYPSPALGVTDATSGALDGTTAMLTSAGLAAFGQLKGPVPFDAGAYGYGATVNSGAPYTSFLTDSAGDTMAGVYQHPDTGVAELALNFDYNANQTQWLLLAPGLINWVTQDTHLGLYRNYFGQDIDDTFFPDNEWSSQYQCTPASINPPDYTCPPAVQGVPAGSAPGVPADVQMSAADVAYVANWEQQTGITLELAFNGQGACTTDSVADESDANCTGSYTDGGTTYTDPGQDVETGYPDDSGLSMPCWPTSLISIGSRTPGRTNSSAATYGSRRHSPQWRPADRAALLPPGRTATRSPPRPHTANPSHPRPSPSRSGAAVR